LGVKSGFVVAQTSREEVQDVRQFDRSIGKEEIFVFLFLCWGECDFDGID